MRETQSMPQSVRFEYATKHAIYLVMQPQHNTVKIGSNKMMKGITLRVPLLSVETIDSVLLHKILCSEDFLICLIRAISICSC